MSWFKRVFLRDPTLIRERTQVNNKVCMVVWNTFETDARVTKEATTLITKGNKDVTVIAVHQPGRTKHKEQVKGINVIRVDRTFKKTSDSIKSSSTNERPVQPLTSISKKQRLKKRIFKLFILAPKLIINSRFFLEAYRQNAGIYHAHDLNTFIPVFIASRLRGAKLVYDAHEVSTDRAGWGNKWFWEKVENILIRRADRVITTNLTRGEFFRDHYKISLPYIIRNVPKHVEIEPTNLIRESLHIPNHTPVVLYQGGMQRDRGLENIIKTIKYVPDAAFVFLGNGQLKPKLIELANNEGVTDRVYFLEAVSNDQLLYYTSSATIGLQLLINTCFNHYSACSNKLHEYLMAGIPVVASDLPEIRRVVNDTKTGILVNPEEIQEIAEAINKLLREEETYQTYKLNTKSGAFQYKWEDDEKILLELYQ
ncbi:glycosyl transferase family 1 [Bacillus sp. UMB0899]|nr:glycosyl transferase family 1 [Bacillus sp. UMB0899]